MKLQILDKEKIHHSSEGSYNNYLWAVAVIIIIIVDVSKPDTLRFLRSTIASTVLPIISGLYAPIEIMSGAFFSLKENKKLQERNKILLKEISSLEKIKQDYKNQTLENNQLRSIVNYNKKVKFKSVVARVVGDSGGLFDRTLRINRGTHDGIAINQTVIGSRGVLGRVSSASENHATVLLLNNINSSIPVIILGSEQNAILTGEGLKNPILKFVRDFSSLRIGQVVSTTGYGGVFVPDRPVGTITKIKDETIEVSLYSKAGDDLYVRIVRFDYENVDANSVLMEK